MSVDFDKSLSQEQKNFLKRIKRKNMTIIQDNHRYGFEIAVVTKTTEDYILASIKNSYYNKEDKLTVENIPIKIDNEELLEDWGFVTNFKK